MTCGEISEKSITETFENLFIDPTKHQDIQKIILKVLSYAERCITSENVKIVLVLKPL